MQSIIFDASLVLILLQELGRSCSERVVVSYAIQPRLAGLVYPLCELFLRPVRGTSTTSVGRPARSLDQKRKVASMPADHPLTVGPKR